ncbi:MAG: alpha-2-macroglobulin family protein [Candidatus Kariarchaeaceae archaeon]
MELNYSARKIKEIKSKLLTLTILFFLLATSFIVSNSNASSTKDGAEDLTFFSEPEVSNEPEYTPLDLFEQSYTVPNDFLPKMADQNLNGAQGDLSLSSSYDRVNIDVESVIVDVGSSMSFTIQITRDFAPVVGRTVTIQIYEGRQYSYFYYGDDYSVTILESFSETTNGDGEIHTSFTPSESGIFTIRVINEYTSTYRFFSAAEIGVLFRAPYYFMPNAGIEAYALVVNSSTMEPVANAFVTMSIKKYSYYDEYEDSIAILDSGYTDVNGLLTLTNDTISFDSYYYDTILEVNASINDVQTSASRYSWVNWQSHTPIEQITTLDKTIYQPGETVYGRSQIQEVDYWRASRTPAVNKECYLSFQSPEGRTMSRWPQVTNDQGVLIFELPLDSALDAGDYKLLIECEQSSELVNITVDRYIKPAFRVTIDPEKDYVKKGETIKGVLSTEYYFGKPVPFADITLTFKLSNFEESITGTADVEGLWDFSWKLPSSVEIVDFSMEISALATDEFEREATGSVSLDVTPDDFHVGVYAWSHPYILQPDDQPTIYFSAYSWVEMEDEGYYYRNWNSLANKDVTVEIFALNFIKIGTYEGKTNDWGYGSVDVEITLDQISYSTEFSYKVTVHLASDGYESDTYNFIYANVLIDMELSQQSYGAGDELSFTVTSRKATTLASEEIEARIYIYDSEYDLVGDTTVTIDGSKSFTFKLSSSAPDGTYNVYLWGIKKSFLDRYYYYWYNMGSARAEFEVGSPEVLEIETSQSEVSIGELFEATITISEEVVAPVIVEFSKRGIYSYAVIDERGTYDLSMVIDFDLAPKFMISVISINSRGQLLYDVILIEVDPTLVVDIQTDKEQYEPGETMEVTIQLLTANGSPVNGTIGASFIDSALFAVKADERTEEEHNNLDDYWPTLTTTASWGIHQNHYWYWWGYYYYDFGGINYARDGYLEVGVADDSSFEGAAQGQEPTITVAGEEVKIRDDFKDSTGWNPNLFVPEEGVSLNISLPDNIGEWTIRVVAIKSNYVTIGTKAITTFLPFFVELNRPLTLLQDDFTKISGIVYNYLEEDAEVTISLSIPEATVLSNSTQKFLVPKDYAAQVSWSVYLREAGDVSIQMVAWTIINDEPFSDGIRDDIYIYPNGLDWRNSQSGVAEGQDSIIRYLPEQATQSRTYLYLSSGFIDTALSSWERLVGYPYGCVEQTTSKLVPTVMIYQYLNETGGLTEELKAMLTDMITVALSRLYTFQHSDGSWGWWSEDESNSYITAFVLNALNQVEKSGIYVNPEVVDAGITSLKNHEDQGSYSTPFWNIPSYDFTAYVLRTLMLAETEVDLSSLIDDIISFLMTGWETESNRSPYAASLIIQLFEQGGRSLSPEEVLFEDELITYLENSYHVDENGYFWGDSDTRYYYRSLGGNVETTANVIQALAILDFVGYYELIEHGTDWIMSQQGAYGWDNTADTSAAISALTLIGQLSEPMSVYDVEVLVNGEHYASVSFNNTDPAMTNSAFFDLTLEMDVGENNVSFEVSGEGRVSYYLQTKEYIRPNITMTTDEEIHVAPGEQITVVYSVSSIGDIAYVADVNITNQESELQLISGVDRHISLLNGTEYIAFVFIAPDNTGDYSIKGPELSYRFSDSSKTVFSPGIVVKEFTSIKVIVEEDVTRFQRSSIVDPLRLNYNPITLSVSSAPTIAITRVITGEVESIGDIVKVKVTLDNNDDEQMLLIYEEQIPTGFEVDTGSLEQGDSISEVQVRSGKISFFITSLNEGEELSFSYRLIVLNTQGVSLPAGTLSSMYSTWELTSKPERLGENPTIFNWLGEAVSDLIAPEITNVQTSQKEDKSSIDLTFEATDDIGVKIVSVYYLSDENDGWRESYSEIKQSGEEFTTVIGPFSTVGETGKILIKVEDQVGNIKTTEVISFIVDALENIPTWAIVSLASIAVISSVATYFYLRRRHSIKNLK